MIITHLEKDSFKIQNGPVSILINPHGNRVKGDVVLKTSVPIDQALTKEEGVVSGGGEYELSGITIYGYNSGHADETQLRTVYVVELEQFRIGILDDFPKLPNDNDIVEHLTDLDILIIPTPEAHIIKHLQPKIAILPPTKNGKDIEKEMGQTAEHEEKLTIKYKDLPATGPKLIVLK